MSNLMPKNSTFTHNASGRRFIILSSDTKTIQCRRVAWGEVFGVKYHLAINSLDFSKYSFYLPNGVLVADMPARLAMAITTEAKTVISRVHDEFTFDFFNQMVEQQMVKANQAGLTGLADLVERNKPAANPFPQIVQNGFAHYPYRGRPKDEQDSKEDVRALTGVVSALKAEVKALRLKKIDLEGRLARSEANHERATFAMRQCMSQMAANVFGNNRAFVLRTAEDIQIQGDSIPDECRGRYVNVQYLNGIVQRSIHASIVGWPRVKAYQLLSR